MSDDPVSSVRPDGLSLAFMQLCRSLKRPYSSAQILAAAPPTLSGSTAGTIRLAADRLGFKTKCVDASLDNLRQVPPPFLLIGQKAGEGWLVTSRLEDQLELAPVEGGEASFHAITELAERASEILLAKPHTTERTPGDWRTPIMQRLKPILWELGLASVIINLLALATPIFLMTVYNKVINHGALKTLDVLAIGMVTLFAFDWLLRSLRSYITSHAGGRLDAALGSEVAHHLVHQPLKTFEQVPTGQIMERLRQLDQLRLFFTRRLTEQGLYPRLRLIAAERQLGDLAGDIRKTGARLASAEAAYAEAKSERDSFELEWRSLILAELAEIEAERDGLAEAMKRQRTMLEHLVVRAPVDGIVQELVIAGDGQSVGSNEPLMKLVPIGAGLVVRAKVDNQDIGYLEVGQSAKVKVRAFDFLRFGALEGAVQQIAADATPDQQDGALRYGITVETDTAELTDGETWHSVVPGMAVEVDLLVRERTILSYLTDRIFRMPEEVFQEG